MVFSYSIGVSNDEFVVFPYYIGVSNDDFVVVSFHIGFSNDDPTFCIELFYRVPICLMNNWQGRRWGGGQESQQKMDVEFASIYKQTTEY